MASNSNAEKVGQAALQTVSVLILWKKYLILAGLLLAALLFTLFIGLVVIFTGAGSSSNTATTGSFVGGTANVSAAVLKYEPLVAKYASKYGIPDYVGLMLALIQQESGGTPSALAKDPMQSSESLCGYVGCISSPEQSIDQGVKHFKSVLESAGYDVKLTLQSYNFGPGFINYVKARGGKYTKELAISFSQEMYAKEIARGRGGMYSCMRQEAKPLKACYGDILYVDAVLKNYIGGVEGSGTTLVNASGAVKKAIEVGKTALGRPYKWAGGRTPASIARKEFDCSSFVWWAYTEAGVDLGPMGATTETLKHKGVRVSVNDIKVGDLIFWNTYKTDGHVGIYIGNDQFIGAQDSTGIAIANFRSHSYWGSSKIFTGHVRRVVQ